MYKIEQVCRWADPNNPNISTDPAQNLLLKNQTKQVQVTIARGQDLNFYAE